MDITLSPEIERLVQERVAQGAYPNASALIGEAVHLLLDWDCTETELESLVQQGIQSGPPEQVSAQDWKQLRDEVHTVRAARKRE